MIDPRGSKKLDSKQHIRDNGNLITYSFDYILSYNKNKTRSMLCRYNTNTLTCCNGSTSTALNHNTHWNVYFFLDTKRLHQTRSIYGYTCLETPSPSPRCWTENLETVKLTTAYPKIVRPCSIKPLEYA